MSFDPDFLTQMRSLATYKQWVGNDLYGDTPTFASVGQAITFPCHITYKRKILRTNTEEDAVSTAQIQLPPGGYIYNGVPIPTLAIEDHVILPDGVDRKCLDITTYFDESGVPQHQSASLT
jgi:hypothetical protein